MALPRVAASEHELIALARALLRGPTGKADAWAILAAPRAMPAAIGPTCAALLADTLGQTWRALALRGGALPGRSIGPAGIAHGRVWQRHAAVPLDFTGATVALLRWLVATPLAQPPSAHTALPALPLGTGDQVLIYLALDAARGTPAATALAAQPLVRASPLAWLAAAEVLASEPLDVPPFAALTTGAGAVIVEALAPELARAWAATERTKRLVARPEALIALGAAQDAVLAGFLAACDAARRRDLAAWIIDAAAPGLAAANGSPEPLQLDRAAPLGLRSRARVAAGSLLRAAVQWAAWDHAHRGVRFFDDDFATTQLLLERFERIGAAGADRAAGWLEVLAALYPASTP